MDAKATELLNAIHHAIKIEKTVDSDGCDDYPEDKNYFKASIIKPEFVKFSNKHYKETVTSIEKKFKKGFEEVLEVVAPFGVLFVATGQVTFDKFYETILAAPEDAEIIPNFCEESEFKEKLFTAYKVVEEFKPKKKEFSTKGFKLTALEKHQKETIDTLLKSYKQPTWESILDAFSSVADSVERIQEAENALKDEQKKAAKEKLDLKKKLSKVTEELAAKPYKEIKVASDGAIPNGKIVLKKAKDVFPGIQADMDIPTWEWDGVHPDVPAVDDNYIFREELLMPALYSIVSKERMYLQGHTGSGKTTLVEQIAARLNWPFARINFDSEITRMDLIGRDTLKDGVSVFVDGVLPRLMSGPYMAVFDEIDFCRPDVAYVMQSVLEGNSFRITEDGGRLVEPHPMFRMFATGNTVGQGDEEGMYQGARPQSLAFLDRFTIWAKVEYLEPKERRDLLERSVPALTDGELTTIIKHTDEHLAAFTSAKVLQPISPRGMIAIGKAVVHFNSMYPEAKDNIHKALKMVVIDRATSSDRTVLMEIVDRVCK